MESRFFTPLNISLGSVTWAKTFLAKIISNLPYFLLNILLEETLKKLFKNLIFLFSLKIFLAGSTPAKKQSNFFCKYFKKDPSLQAISKTFVFL